jgi:hypothetical protein
MLDHKPFSIK